MPAIQHGNVLKRAPGRYEARWSDSSGKRRAKMFRSKTEARAFLRGEVEEVAKQRRGEVAQDRPETVDKLLDLFLEKHGRTVDPATEKKLKTQLKHARTTFGTRKPESLKKGEIEDWRLGLSAGSRHDVFRAFRQALAWASDPDRGLLERNLSDGIPNPKRPKHERAEVHPFKSWAEIESVCAELDVRYRAFVVTMVGCGLRPEEACGLHRSDVDREKMQLHVRRRFTQGVVKAGSKTDAGRIVPFGQRVLAALDAMPPRIDTPILFPAPRGGYIDIEKLRHREWAPALRAAGLDHHRLYDLRHTHITWALQGNQPIAVIAKNAGTSIAQLDATYSRPTEDASKAVAEAVDSYAV